MKKVEIIGEGVFDITKIDAKIRKKIADSHIKNKNVKYIFISKIDLIKEACFLYEKFGINNYTDFDKLEKLYGLNVIIKDETVII